MNFKVLPIQHECMQRHATLIYLNLSLRQAQKGATQYNIYIYIYCILRSNISYCASAFTEDASVIPAIDVVAKNGFHAVKWHVESFNLRYYLLIFCQKKFLASQLLRA